MRLVSHSKCTIENEMENENENDIGNGNGNGNENGTIPGKASEASHSLSSFSLPCQ